MTRNDPALAEKVCLALVTEGPTHGWAVSGLLASEAEIGRIWSLSRPLTYRALDQLGIDGMIEKVGTAPGAGRNRTLLAATSRGRMECTRWLEEPVLLPRDVRTELLVKFALRTRRGLGLQPLARGQREVFAPFMAMKPKLLPVSIEGDSELAESADFVDLWKREHLLAIDRFLEAIENSVA
ncbi:MAG: hypothetical protein WEA11_09245 [Acidimicrobiales bacterium]